MPKIGLILECGAKGPDQLVCEHLAGRLDPEIEVVSRPLSCKTALLNDCGKAASALLEDGCQRVVILWDLYPSWRQSQTPCRKSDREMIFASLRQSGVPLDVVYLVCIKAEIETWLLFDERALSEVIGSNEHPVKISREKKIEQNTNPKARLKLLFEKHGRQYSEFAHAKKIVEAMPDLQRIKKCSSFVRFANKVAGIDL